MQEGLLLNYLRLIPLVLSNTLSQMWDRLNLPSLNNNIGKFNLSHIWDRVLLNTNGISLK